VRVVAVAVVAALALPASAAAQTARSAGSVNPCVARGAGGAVERIQLLPVDDAASRRDFFMFRARLQAAIARRDEAAVVAAADPGIRTSFGDDDGIARFTAQLRDAGSSVWADLGAALALGGAFTAQTTFQAPYVFARWPDAADSFECLAVLGDRVRVRQSADPTSAIVATTSYELVQALPERTETAVRIRLASGITGYISSAFVRSPIEHRAIFEQSGGQWRLRAFVAGD
jgi:hypothetical protein